MSPKPVTTATIYERLRADILSGRFPPGAQLNIHALAVEYGVSIGPVRDSAERLVGERLLRIHSEGGFKLPGLSAKGLRDMYLWHGQLIRNALKRPARGDQAGLSHRFLVAEALQTPTELAAAASSLFAAIARRSRNWPHVEAVILLGRRLNTPRLVEPLVIRNVAGELNEIVSLTARGSDPDLREAIWAYHRRRMRRTHDLAQQVWLAGNLA